MTEAGVPILEELRKQFEAMGEIGITAGQVFDKISQRQVTFEMVKKVFVDMTSEGGKFYQMQEVLADSLKGKISNLKDAYQIMMSEIGERHSEGLKNTVDWMRRLMQNAEGVGTTLVWLVEIYGTFKAALAVTSIVQAIKTYGSLADAISKTALAQKVLNSALYKNPFAIVAAGLVAIIGYFAKVKKDAESLNREFERIASNKIFEGEKLISGFVKLSAQLRASTKDSENYREAIRKLNSQYGDYLPKILTERDALETLNQSYQKVIASIRLKAQAEAQQEGYLEIERKYGEAAKNNFNKLSAEMRKRDNEITAGDVSSIASNYIEAIRRAIAKGKVYGEMTGDDKKSIFQSVATSYLKRYYATFYNTDELKAVIGYADAMIKAEEEKAKVDEYMKSASGTGYSMQSERIKVEEITKAYNDEVEKLGNLKMSTDEYNQKLKDLDISRLKQLEQLYSSLGRMDMAKQMRDQLDELTAAPERWVEIVNGVISKLGLKASDGLGNLLPSKNISKWDYANSLADGYKSINEQIEKGAVIAESDMPKFLKIKQAYESVSAALRIPLMTSKKQKPALVSDLEQEYQLVKTIIDQYNRLKREYPDKNENDILSSLGSIWGDKLKTTDFNAWVDGIVSELKKLGQYGQEAADKILGKDTIQDGSASFAELVKRWDDEADAIKKAQKALEKYNEETAKWEAQDFTISGTGALFDLSKTLRDLKTKEEELKIIQLENLEQLEAARSQMSEEDYQMQLFRLKELYNANVAYERKLTAEKIKELGKRYGQDAVKDNTKIKTRDYGDLSLGQIKTSIYELNQLLSMTDSQIAGLLSDEDLQKLKEAGLSLQDFIDAYREYLKAKKQDNETETFKKVIKSARKLIGYVSTLSSSLRDLGESRDNDGLIAAADAIDKISDSSEFVLDMMDDLNGALSDTSDEVKELADSALKSFDLVTMVVKGIVWVAKNLIDVFAQSGNKVYELNGHMNAVNRTLETYINEARLAIDTTTLFGDNLFQSVRNAKSELSRLNKETKDFVDSLRWGDAQFGYGKNLYEEAVYLLKRKNLSLFSEDGSVNSASIEWLKGVYEEKDTYVDWESFINYAKEYEEVLESIDETISSIFGDMASSMADNLIEAFNATGDAISNVDDVFRSFGSNFVKTMLQSILLENVFNKYQDQLREIFMSDSTYVQKQAEVEKMFNSMSADLETYRDDINMFLEEAQSRGWLGDSGDSSLQSSIQGITEETASRLANLMNGIYSENFRQGELMDELLMYVGAMDIAGINDNLNLGLVELKAINENTLRSANNSDRIVDAINNLMTYGGQSAMNVRLLN